MDRCWSADRHLPLNTAVSIIDSLRLTLRERTKFSPRQWAYQERTWANALQMTALRRLC